MVKGKKGEGWIQVKKVTQENISAHEDKEGGEKHINIWKILLL